MLPLFNIRMPSNLNVVFKIIMNIAAFDILPTDYIYDLIFKVDQKEPLSTKFEAMGFESLWLIYNLGSLLLISLSIPLLMAFLPALKFFSQYSKRVLSSYKRLRKFLFWNFQITVITESYTILIIGSFISTKKLLWTGFTYSVNSGLTCLLLSILIGYPLLILFTLNRYWDQIETKQFK